MRLFLALLSVLVLASCSSSTTKPPAERTIPTVRVPALSKAPDTSPVEKAAEGMRRDLDDATAEIRDASNKVEEGVRDASILRNLTAKALEQATLENETLLSKINDAAEAQSQRMEETAEMLVKATVALAAANTRSETLAREVSKLRADVVLQTERAIELQAAAKDANRQTLEANLEKDQVRDALNDAAGKDLSNQLEISRLKKHRLWLAGILGILVVGLLTKLLFRIYKPPFL